MRLLSCWKEDVDVYLHFIIDNIYSEKFIQIVNNNFKDIVNKFIVISYEPIKYIRFQCYQNVEFIQLKGKRKKLSREQKSRIKKFINESEKIFVHFLEDNVIKILFNSNKKIYWALWGADFYNFINIDLYQSSTRNVLSRINQQNNKNNNLFRSLIIETKENLKKLIWFYRYIRRKLFIKKVSYILTWNHGDYDLVVKNFNTCAKRINFFYPIPTSFSSLENAKSRPINHQYDFKAKFKYVIQVGNSGDPTNNHLEVFEMLRNINSEDFCVVAILSYGPLDYIKELIKEGQKLLGNKFIPITEYLSPEEYSYILEQVDVSIMNHKRQQGVGNLISLLYLRKKVYINEYITTFEYFLENNIKVFSVSELRNSNVEEIFSFSDDFKNRNREIVKNLFSEDRAIELISSVFEN